MAKSALRKYAGRKSRGYVRKTKRAGWKRSKKLAKSGWVKGSSVVKARRAARQDQKWTSVAPVGRSGLLSASPVGRAALQGNRRPPSTSRAGNRAPSHVLHRGTVSPMPSSMAAGGGGRVSVRASKNRKAHTRRRPRQ